MIPGRRAELRRGAGLRAGARRGAGLRAVDVERAAGLRAVEVEREAVDREAVRLELDVRRAVDVRGRGEVFVATLGA